MPPVRGTATSIFASPASGRDSEANATQLPLATDTSVPILALILPKLVQRILCTEFVDMHELLPDTWKMEEQWDLYCWSTWPKRGLVTDIDLWMKCYASLMAVLTSMTHLVHGPITAYWSVTTRDSNSHFLHTLRVSQEVMFRHSCCN